MLPLGGRMHYGEAAGGRGRAAAPPEQEKADGSGSGQPEASQRGSRRRASASRGVAAMMAFARAISSW